MDIQGNVDLAQFSSFRVGGKAQYFFEATSDKEVQEALLFARHNNLPTTILGGGSNIIISDNGIAGVVIYINIKGLETLEENTNRCLLKIGAGEVWDEVVAFAVKNNLWGIENLSAIPGKTGAFASGNIGAYGQDASQVLQSVQTINIQTGKVKTFYNSEMKFAYRSSIFNSSEQGDYVITQITLELHKNPSPNLSYKDVQKYFEKQIVANAEFQPSLEEIRQAIISIRQAKLPDPKEIGNAGSFFKNVLVDADGFAEIQQAILKNYGQEAAEKINPKAEQALATQKPDVFKISAAYLVELCGLKGFTMGSAQVYPKHSLVIINTGGASASDILKLAKHIRREVFEQTKAQLMPEPIFLGFTDGELQKFCDLT
jgi:UDP-N-acetylmuramate dehydrogenase